MAQVVPAVARFELKYRQNDATMENVYYARTSSLTWTDTEMDDAVAAFLAWETGTASLIRNGEIEMYEIIATDLTSLFGIRKAYDVSPPVSGTLASALPPNATVACKADIGRRGRGTAGRTFWIGLSETQLEAGGTALLTSAVTGILTALNALVNDIATLPPIEGLCIPHFVVDHVRPPSVQADITVRYLMSDFTLDSQRDRLPNHKKHKRFPIA